MEELDLKELFNIFWQRKLEIATIILIFVIIGAVYTYAILQPKYTSYTTLLLTQVNGNNETGNDTSITQTDLTLNSKLISTYSEIIKRDAVLREVIDDLNIKNLTEDSLRRSIKVSSISDTEIIKIEVTNENPNYAQMIANKIAEVFSEKITDIYKINNVYVLDKAVVSENPSNINHLKDIVIFAFIGVVIACGYALLANMLDNTVKTEADIEKLTGLTVLATIPDYDTEVKGGKR